MPEASRSHVSPVGAARLRRQRRRHQQLRGNHDTLTPPRDAAAVGRVRSRTASAAESTTDTTVGPATDSAARPAAGRPPIGTIVRDLLRPSKAQAVIAVILCLCTMGAIWQVRGSGTDQAYSQMTRTELVGLLDQVNTSNGQLRSEIARLEAQKAELQTGADSSRVAQDQARKRVDELGILAGSVPAQGSGIVITITDHQGGVGHELLLDAVEEMRDAGAEAMEINGIRVVASSWFGESGGSLVIDGTAISAPYVLRIIGDPQTLDEGARFRGGLVSQAEAPQVGAKVSIVRSEQLTITSVHTTKPPEFARPA